MLGNDSLEDVCSLLTHVPGDELRVLDLTGAVSQTPDGQHIVDWSTVATPGMVDPSLPTGQPLRLAGQLFFFGVNEHIEY